MKAIFRNKFSIILFWLFMAMSSAICMAQRNYTQSVSAAAAWCYVDGGGHGPTARVDYNLYGSKFVGLTSFTYLALGYPFRNQRANANWETAKSFGIGLGLRVVPLPYPVLDRLVVKFGGVCAYEEDFYEHLDSSYSYRLQEINAGPFLGGEFVFLKGSKYDVCMIGSYQALTHLQGYFGLNATMKL